MYEKLPQELKERGAFCLWKNEERDGNRTKVPYQTNGLRADSANKATFTDYAIAVRHRAGYDGIGIGVFGDICAIDIDSCVENGVLSDMAEDIIARMDTYTEYSPSGTGVRILFRASLPAYDKDLYYINNRRIKLEVYVAGYTSRFVTVTGNAISGTGVEERTDALTEVLEKYMRKAEKPLSRVAAPGSYLSDTSVLQKALASKQSEKFKTLWNGVTRELAQAKERIGKLDGIIQRLYEDNVEGKISDERFAKLSASYETEQNQLESRKAELTEFIDASKEQRLNVDSFLSMVRKYTDIRELTAEIIRSFVEKIEVLKPEKVPGTRTKKQTIVIYWNFIGAVEIPVEAQEKTA